MRDSSALMRLHATIVIDAHGSWEDLHSDRPKRRHARGSADLFAFKANFSGSTLPEGQISVLALDGGYGGMVVADGGTLTLACCIRRDRLCLLRDRAPGLSAGDAVEAWLRRECFGVQHPLHGAQRDGVLVGHNLFAEQHQHFAVHFFGEDMKMKSAVIDHVLGLTANQRHANRLAVGIGDEAFKQGALAHR